MHSSIPSQLVKGSIPAYRHIHDLHRLIHLESRGNYTLIYVVDSPNPLLASKTLKYFELLLPAFVRLSKGVLINPGFVKGVSQRGPALVSVELSTGFTFGVARRRIGSVLDQLKKPA